MYNVAIEAPVQCFEVKVLYVYKLDSFIFGISSIWILLARVLSLNTRCSYSILIPNLTVVGLFGKVLKYLTVVFVTTLLITIPDITVVVINV